MPRLIRSSTFLVPALLALGLMLSLFGGILLSMGLSQGSSLLQPGAGRSLAATTSTPTATATCQNAAKAANPVAAENTCPGTKSWRMDHHTGPDHAIEGFAVPVSVNVGGTVHLYVSTTARSYTFQVFRLGWYQGLGGHLVYSSGKLAGILQPAPTIDPATNEVSCANWRGPIAVPVASTWVSGYYLVKLLSSDGYMRYASFVVRQDASPAPIVYYTAALTYQAYNLWGGYSLSFGPGASTGSPNQTFSRTNRAYVVSFDRPYADYAGVGLFLPYEFNLLRWLERQNYNMSYAADLDAQQSSLPLLQHKLLLFAGHDEYWSTAMRTHVTTARDSGVSLAFFSAGDIYWHIRLQPTALGPDRAIVCYREAGLDPLLESQPQAITVTWRQRPLNNPEDSLLGQMSAGTVAKTAPLVLASGAAPYLRDTTLAPGASLPGLVGDGYDSVMRDATAPAGVIVLAASPVACTNCASGGSDTANATLYFAKSGARVFDAGTFRWAWGLDDDPFDPRAAPRTLSNPGFQQFTANLLGTLLATPAR